MPCRRSVRDFQFGARIFKLCHALQRPTILYPALSNPDVLAKSKPGYAMLLRVPMRTVHGPLHLLMLLFLCALWYMAPKCYPPEIAIMTA